MGLDHVIQVKEFGFLVWEQWWAPVLNKDVRWLNSHFRNHCCDYSVEAVLTGEGQYCFNNLCKCYFIVLSRKPWTLSKKKYYLYHSNSISHTVGSTLKMICFITYFLPTVEFMRVETRLIPFCIPYRISTWKELNQFCGIKYFKI